jgi:hypothetical protein
VQALGDLALSSVDLLPQLVEGLREQVAGLPARFVDDLGRLVDRRARQLRCLCFRPRRSGRSETVVGGRLLGVRDLQVRAGRSLLCLIRCSSPRSPAARVAAPLACDGRIAGKSQC